MRQEGRRDEARDQRGGGRVERPPRPEVEAEGAGGGEHGERPPQGGKARERKAEPAQAMPLLGPRPAGGERREAEDPASRTAAARAPRAWAAGSGWPVMNAKLPTAKPERASRPP